MERLAIVGVLTVWSDRAWNELDVGHEALVGLLDLRHHNLLHLGGGLLATSLLLLTVCL